MVATLLHAGEVQPGRRGGKKFYACDQAWTLVFLVSADQLRSDREKELVHATLCYKLPEKTGTAFVK